MQLLVLESMHDDPLVRSPVPGFGAAAAAVARLTRAQTFPVENTNLNSASNGILSAYKPEEDTRLLYPFRIKHLGKPESYTLYAPTAANQRDWCEKIIEAKERHVATLLAKNEPFQLRVIAGQSFRYSIASSTRRGSGVHIRGSSLDRAIRAMERQCTDIAAGYLTSVHCATEFLWNGESKLAIGADDGIYISEGLTPRKWTRVSLAMLIPTYRGVIITTMLDGANQECHPNSNITNSLLVSCHCRQVPNCLPSRYARSTI